MAARDKMVELLERLIKLTANGRIPWKPANEAPYSYEYADERGRRIVIDSRDDDGRPPFDLVVYASNGELVSDLRWTGTGTRLDGYLVQLWNAGRDTATGTSRLLDDILDDLPN